MEMDLIFIQFFSVPNFDWGKNVIAFEVNQLIYFELICAY